MSNELIKTKGLSFNYTLGVQKIEALFNIDLNIQSGDFVGLIGPSGSGKTTLLNLLGLIESVQMGLFLFEGQDLSQLNEIEKNSLRRFHIGFIFQSFNLFPTLNAYENVDFFLARQGIQLRERSFRVQEALTLVGLWESRRQHPLEMSGGQRQRVAIARAIAKKPKLIIADEPTASLDQGHGRSVMEILNQLNKESGLTIVISSHDPMVQTYMKRKVSLQDGRIVGVE